MTKLGKKGYDNFGIITSKTKKWQKITKEYI